MHWVAALQEAGFIRLWDMDPAGTVLAQHRLPPVTPDELGPVIAEMTGGAARTVLTCGVAGDGIAHTPCPALNIQPMPLIGGRLRHLAIAGLAQDTPAHVSPSAPPKVAGFLAMNPKFDGVLCLPGPQTAWLHISAEEVVSLQTFVTADIARDMAARLGLPATAWEESAFAPAVSDTMANPERLAARLASIQAEGMLTGLREGVARTRLWGALIGAELAAARPYWLGQQVAVLGGQAIAPYYVTALQAQGVQVIQADGEAMLLKGFAEAMHQSNA